MNKSVTSVTLHADRNTRELHKITVEYPLKSVETVKHITFTLKLTSQFHNNTLIPIHPPRFKFHIHLDRIYNYIILPLRNLNPRYVVEETEHPRFIFYRYRSSLSPDFLTIQLDDVTVEPVWGSWYVRLRGSGALEFFFASLLEVDDISVDDETSLLEISDEHERSIIQKLKLVVHDAFQDEDKVMGLLTDILRVLFGEKFTPIWTVEGNIQITDVSESPTPPRIDNSSYTDEFKLPHPLHIPPYIMKCWNGRETVKANEELVNYIVSVLSLLDFPRRAVRALTQSVNLLVHLHDL